MGSLSDSEVEKDLSALMRKAQRGDEIAYRDLLIRIEKMLQSFVKKSVSQESVDDVIQEIILALHQKRHTFDTEQFFLPWLYAIARHKVVDYIRVKSKAEILSATPEDFENLLTSDVEGIMSVVTVDDLGKNFSGAYFERVATTLKDQGYRVILPDQIGFGKSTKPENFQYTLQALATYTFQLLDSLGVKKFVLLGHSMGGMLATRMALMSPGRIQKLVLEDPLGLEDWRLLTSYKSVDELYAMELQSSPEKIKAYQMENYYGGIWKPEYQPLVDMLVGWQQGSDFPLIAWNNALTSEMLFTQPVYYEFKFLKMPVVLIVGEKDRTALGKAWAPPENKDKMGRYPEIAKKVISMVPQGRLVVLKGLGHVPHIEDFSAFMPVLVKSL